MLRRLFNRQGTHGHAAHTGCNEARDNASAFVDGDMPPGLSDRIRKHLGLCQGCDGWMNTFKATVGLLREMPSEPPPKSLKDRVRSIMREQ